MTTSAVRPASDKLAPHLPDLLHHQPSVSLDYERVRRDLFVAFQTGDAEQRLERVMDEAGVAPSAWTGSSFRVGLYMDVLVSRCMAVRIGSKAPKLNRRYLLRLLENPPSDDRSVAFRRSILAELVEQPTCREDFESVYSEICLLRTQLQALDNVGYFDSRVRRLHVLSVLHGLFVTLEERFAGARSGLSRISAFAAHVRRSRSYAHLSELMLYEDGMSKVQFKMRLGSDGSLRKFEIVEIDENTSNPFYQSPWRRLMSKVGMWWRGYKVGNSGLLDAWLEEVFIGMLSYLPELLRLVGDMEFYLAGLAFRDACEQRGLPTSFPTLLPVGAPASEVCLDGMFNPLLFTQDCVPVPCRIDGESFVSKTILTGPNSGGKTRLLQSLGVTQVLAESGMYAPVARARLPRANGLFVSLIEEGAVDQSEGRLGMELLRIRQLFEHAQVGSLVILDELCSGTNPSEGEEIFLLVLSLLEELDARTVIATHFLDFARRLESECADALNLAFLQVEIGEHDLPTYQFRPGVARTSMALQTAQRLGVTDALLRSLVHRQRLSSGSCRGSSTNMPSEHRL